MYDILIIEDNVSLCKLYERVLKGVRANIAYAHTCQQAYQYFQEHSPQLILLDMKLPDGDGEEILNWMKSQPHLGSASVVIISSENRNKNAHLLAQVNDFIVKPISSPHLLELVNRFVGAA